MKNYKYNYDMIKIVYDVIDVLMMINSDLMKLFFRIFATSLWQLRESRIHLQLHFYIYKYIVLLI